MKFIEKNNIWYGILCMGIGTIGAQIVNVLAQPILTRIVSPEILGIYTYIVSLAAIVIPVASLKLDMLIVTEESDKKAQYLTDACIIVILINSIICFCVIGITMLISKDNIFNKYGNICLLVPALVFTNGLRFLFISYNNRYKNYRLISKVAIIREFARALIQIAMGLFSCGVVGQTMGYALSPLFGLQLQMKDYLQKFKARPGMTYNKFKQLILIDGRKQILYLVPAQFINSFSASLIAISITSLFSATSLGYYSAGVRMLDLPIVFITSNVSKVVLQRASECVEKQKPFLKTMLSIVIVLTIISLIGFGMLYLLAPQIAGFVFGKGYEVSGYYIRCLCVMYAIRLVSTSFAGLFTVFGKQKYEFWLNILLIVCATLAFIISKAFSLDIIQYLNLIGFGYTLMYVLMIAGYIFLCLKYDNSLTSFGKYHS